MDFGKQATARLKWTLVANMRDVASGVAELKYWVERDPNLVGVYISPLAPGGKLLDNPDLHPLYDAAQSLDLPCRRMAARRARLMAPARGTSTAGGSCCMASATRGLGWRQWVR